jgi:hypothetical protein
VTAPPDDLLDPELRALLDSASSYDEMPASAPGHILAKVSAGLLLAPVITATAASATSGAAKATAWRALKKTATWVAFAGAASGVAGYAAVEHARHVRQAAPAAAAPSSPAPSAPEAPGPAPTVSVPTLNVPAAPPAASVAPATTTVTPASPPQHAEPNEDAELSAERGQLEVARTALARGQAAAALTVLHADAAARPRGRLAEERDSMTIQALALAGRTDEARARAASFTRRYPRSLFLPIVQAAIH